MLEAYYGCLFCAQTGSVVREGDATVFSSSDALFRHLSRHPQPLPEVPGLTVLYGKEFAQDDPRLNDFDLHFVNPPVPGSGIPDSVVPDLVRLPIATATKENVQRYGHKKLPRPEGMSDKEVLQFFTGGRIVGVELPVRWEGKWASGWHDGVWGTFPVKSMELEKPRKHEIPPLLHGLQVGAGMTVTTRWKWDPKDAAEKGWLAFDKGETITNVGWLYRDHWCWSGTNSKGKFGVFPRTHVHFDAVKEDTNQARPGSVKSKKITSRPKLFGRSRTGSSSAASSVSGASGVVELIM